MPSTPLFSETQRFTQWWIWALLIGSTAMVFWAFYRQMSEGAIRGSVWFALIVTLLALVFFLSMHLQTQVNSEGIRVRLFPLHLQYHEFAWSDIRKAHLRTYSPIREFGGWGLRLGRKGWAYNISGNQGLQLEFHNGKQLLIGTQQPGELSQVLKELGQLAE